MLRIAGFASTLPLEGRVSKNALAMTLMHTGPHVTSCPRRDAPEALQIVCPQEIEGAGKTGCALHPRSRVQNARVKNAHEHTGSAETLRPSLRNGFTAYIVLSSVTGFVVTVAPEKR